MDMKVVIIDDEDNNIDNLQQLLLEYCSRSNGEWELSTGADAGALLINRWQPDISIPRY